MRKACIKHCKDKVALLLSLMAHSSNDLSLEDILKHFSRGGAFLRVAHDCADSAWIPYVSYAHPGPGTQTKGHPAIAAWNSRLQPCCAGRLRKRPFAQRRSWP